MSWQKNNFPTSYQNKSGESTGNGVKIDIQG